MTNVDKRRDGFTLIELLVVIAIIALLIGILLPALGEARRAARKAICFSGQKQLAIAMNTYATDFEDQLASFSWERGITPSRYPDLRVAGSHYEAQMLQATDIVRRLSGDDSIPPLRNRFPHRRMSHIVMYEYLSTKLPEESAACPEDKILQGWQSQPDWNNLDPKPNPVRDFMPYWRFTSSYQLVPVAYAPDRDKPRLSTVAQASSDHNLFAMGSAPLGKRKFSDVAFPGAKVAWFDFHDRHTAKFDYYHAYEQASAPTGLFDGSVHARPTSESNQGFYPRGAGPSSTSATLYNYAPYILGFEPPTLSGNQTDLVKGHYRWTRGGLKGVDFDAGEIDTGQM